MKAVLKLSVAASSALEPTAPMLCRTTAGLQSSANALLVYRGPWSVCMILAGVVRRQWQKPERARPRISQSRCTP
ncbi:hypothetical protein ACIQWN_38405 [Streptomyces vinaceus]|uniref:hypothetical protein n=1 Tax=Streptomyces vinaceus TaxID=1960 RepID=UPI003807A649